MENGGVVVTGSGSGIGFAIANRLAHRTAGAWLASSSTFRGRRPARKSLGEGHVVIRGDGLDRTLLKQAREAAEKLAPLKSWSTISASPSWAICTNPTRKPSTASSR